jgi:glucan phosphoethanolaminetransferase (alkaline phosphatase superfamily)
MQSLWTELLAALRQPEYVHVLLHPLPIYGLAAGVFSLLLALVGRSRSGQAIALVLILLTAASSWLVAHYGRAGYDRVSAISGGDALQWLNWHKHLGERIVWVHYATAAFAAAALLGLWKFPRLHRAALILTLVAAAAALSFGGFLAFVGGKIRHSEFRHGPPPAWAHTTADDD